MMFDDCVTISKDELLSFARAIYSKALCGYEELEDSVCLSETIKLCESIKSRFSAFPDGTSNLIVGTGSSYAFSSSSNIGSTYFVNCNPQYPPTTQELPETGFSSPFGRERQLTLFDTNPQREEFEQNQCLLDNDDNDFCDFFSGQDFDSNEGHIQR